MAWLSWGRRLSLRSAVYLAAVGDVNSPVTWSGIPYHFFQAAHAAGLVDVGLPLAAEGVAWHARRLAWNALRRLGGDRKGGYQYSVSFLERLWRPWRCVLGGSSVINCFQLYPPSLVADPSVEKWFFLDQTLTQLFDDYGLRATVGRRIAADALEREHAGYVAARGVVVHSHWAAAGVRACGIAAEKIHVIVPGPSLDRDLYRTWEVGRSARAARSASEPLRLVFVGKYWQRKGLDRLLRALQRARRQGLNATLRVLGCPREAVPTWMRDVAGVEWIGFLDKRREAQRFLDLVAECDLGCLLSRAEAGGIAIREFHALGLPVLATRVGGAPEHTLAGASCLISADAGEAEIAGVLMGLDRDRTRLERLRVSAWSQRHAASWDVAADAWCKLIKEDARDLHLKA
ncbi:MAG: glycosyltransferase family 4 protein [Terriglobales bacterium]